MNNDSDIIKKSLRMSAGYMIFTSSLAIVLGLIMLFYPGGTMKLMEAAFVVFQVLLTVFVLGYTVSEAMHYLKHGSRANGIIYLVVGVVAAVLIWLFSVKIIYIIVAFFLFLSGISDIVGGIRLHVGRYFLILLGITNILIGIAILSYPMMLPLIIAWFVLFWGLSRLFFSMELRRRL